VHFSREIERESEEAHFPREIELKQQEWGAYHKRKRGHASQEITATNEQVRTLKPVAIDPLN
jgi:hypothetical protein